MLLQPFRIGNVEFANRILRSSMGGRTCYYDGTVSPAFTHFEKRFADNGVGGIISATISVTEARMSPLEYPTLHDDRYVGPLREAVEEIKSGNTCRYIIQLGDTGAHTHTSLRPQDQDRLSASSFFDLLYGYHNRSRSMTCKQIEAVIDNFAQAARRVTEARCDGVEITASKGYLIHQFLNPVTNRRTDKYGGSVENRFRFLREIVEAVRREIGRDFLFGVRLSAKDFNILPLNVRLPLVWPLRHYFVGNDLAETTYYARQLELLGIDYLHIDSGFGFPNPKGSPGDYPDEGFLTFVNTTRYLSTKAGLRATLFNIVPGPVRKRIFGLGYRFRPAANADFASIIRQSVGIPVIANGGFQDRRVIDDALASGKCDMVAIARPLLANPDLVRQFARGVDSPDNPCSFCTLCCSQTAVFPLGCYDERRFTSPEEMMKQIVAWSSPNAAMPASRLH
ncbi:tRNA-dihydrouridine synthase [Reyranella sp.]|uniref:oxidoreductase n=1 Tax=Reyranella sp. TaxID=1929291 RepID=UPI0037835E0B